jgi:hypothetical protein
VAPGQEEESEILANERGSQEYEDFLTSIGWEVDLRTHTGLLGGLQADTEDKVCICLFLYGWTGGKTQWMLRRTRRSSSLSLRLLGPHLKVLDGSSTVYYATDALEVVFHVATRIPNNIEEKQFRKVRAIACFIRFGRRLDSKQFVLTSMCDCVTPEKALRER